METSLALIPRMQNLVRDCLEDLISVDEPLAIVDFPDHRNCGDSAIWLGEMACLRDQFGARPAYVCRKTDFCKEQLERASPSGPIFIHGGGNFGDIWLAHQEFRERILEIFPNRPIIQFPQSIHFQSPQRLEHSARVIGRHKNFTLLVRDQESLRLAQQHFDCETRLCPDMAFCIGPLAADAAQFPIIAILRQDEERSRENETWTYPDILKVDWLVRSTRQVRISKARGASSALLAFAPSELLLRKLDAAARYRFHYGIKQISKGQVIVTDRLHVHICSLLLARAHAVLDNSYGKIGRFMDAFSGTTALSYRAGSLEGAISWARTQSGERMAPTEG